MWIDIICGLLVGYFFYLGYTKGIIKTVFGILSVLLGLLITLKFSHLAMQLMEKIINVDPRMNVILGFVLTFLLVLIAIRMLGQGLEKVLETAHINIINQLAGGAVSGLIALVLYASIIEFCDKIKIIKPEVAQRSITYPYLLTVPGKSKAVIDKLKPIFSEFWDKTNEAIHKVDQSTPQKELQPDDMR